ncbi:MAG TPA: choice-of-anchor tandem repeat GloVer-containing protein [Rhizomicrobium sp.]|jgi:uncharacterized repeat protein (TIGR03803 family)|nr:choice-of-anchor tandem repeat GloVer-containing protein [Rhizomicrobium sp.]
MKQLPLYALVFSSFLLNIAEPEAATEKVLYSFRNIQGQDGQNPHSGLIDVNGKLYGTTWFGGIGAGGAGALYSFDPKTGAESVLYTFLAGSDGNMPQGELIDVSGTLYGTTIYGGGGPCADGCGTVFAYNLAIGAEKIVHAFTDGADGHGPFAGLTRVKGVLYGTTYDGGGGSCQTKIGNGCGTVFSVDPKTGAEAVVHAFQSGTADGANTEAGLVYVKGVLYGATYYGGAGTGCSGGCGTVFAIDPATGAETVLNSFSGGTNDGAHPVGGLINVKGTLYGTTEQGGTGDCSVEFYHGCGTVFALNPSTGAEKVLYAFTSDGNGSPGANLIDVNGILYGTTTSGDSCCGAVFSIDPKSGAETLLYSRKGQPDCEYPTSPLTNIRGKFYSTSLQGGGPDAGAIFSIKP